MDGKKLLVMIVNNQKENAKQLSEIMSDDYEIIFAENAEQMNGFLKKYDNDIRAIIVDAQLPEMQNYEIMQKLKKSSHFRVSVIITSEKEDREMEEAVLGLGAYDFIVSPFVPAVFLARLQNAISRSRMVLIEQLRYLADHDSLTGLYNVPKMYTEIRRMLDLYEEKTFACIRIDIDKFRLLNTFWGEKVGDECLIFIADLIKSSLKKYECSVYGRVHADIFFLCIPYEEKAIKKLIKILRNKIEGYNKDYVVEATFGIYVVEDSSVTMENMYSRASMAAKECKKQYMNYVGYYDASMGERLLKEQQIINEMQPALDRRDFVPWFQPKYNLKTGEPYGAEALVRWIHPTKGMIMPGSFIPVFERNGFVGKLDYFMWEATCQCIRRWIDNGWNPAPISVNVSRVSMYNPNIVDLFVGLVQKYNIPPELLNLELTESAYMDNPDIMIRVVEELQSLGFVIMMDDFGSGYSSLNTLKDIPVDILKIDIKFLGSGTDDNRNESILASIIRMAGWLELPVVVEGVETVEQKEFLESVGCGYVQGYYFAKPMPMDNYEEFIQGIHQSPITTISENKEEIINSILSANPQVEFIFKSFQQPVAVYEFTNGVFMPLRVNATFNSWFGYGENIIDAKGNYKQHVTSEAFHSIIAAFEEAITARGMSACEYQWTDLQKRTRWLRMNLKYLGRNEKSQIVFVTFNDETDRKKMEDTLNAYRNILEDTQVVKRKLLVVDDSELSREVVKMIFKDEYDVIEAENGQIGLERLQEQSEDVVAIILDVMMPVMDGKEFLKHKNAVAEIAEIPVIIVSADTDEKNQVNLLELGVNDYITKPFIPDVMKKRVQNVIEYNSRFHQMMREYRNILEMHTPS